MKHVLIVDDSARMRRRIAAVLAESPLIRIIGEAGSGREALEAVKDKRPDTVILDIRLPDQSDIVLLRTFKARYPEMELILPLSVMGLLIATSRYYEVLKVLPLIIPLGVILAALIVLGSYLIIRALRHIHHYDRLIVQLKTCHSKLSRFLD